MNLHGIVGPVIGVVNPPVIAQVLISTGYTTSNDGTQVPSYAAPLAVRAQVQALGWKDLQQLSGINMNGLRRAIYLYGDIDGVVRQAVKGGDLITFGADVAAPLTNTTWLVAQQLEGWGGTAPDEWCKVAAVLQVDQ